MLGTMNIKFKDSGFIVEINKYVNKYTNIFINSVEVSQRQQLLPNKGLFNCILIEIFEVLKALLMKIQISWDYDLC
jgi:hypothetical protein